MCRINGLPGGIIARSARGHVAPANGARHLLAVHIAEAGAGLVHQHDRLAHGHQQILGELPRQVGLDNHTEERLLRRHVAAERQRLLRDGVLVAKVIARYVPVALGAHVLQVAVVVGQLQIGVEHRADDGQAAVGGSVALIQDDEARRDAVGAHHGLEPRANARGGVHLVPHGHGVALAPQHQELVHLHVASSRGPAEVERVGLPDAAEVAH
mmetsp:Transcript_14943/g.62179  ORF Transcript_14943/g.62179 Transcript_14943/m.62179 type:complete len:212 (+) Transcript_14943:125-760(+)